MVQLKASLCLHFALATLHFNTTMVQLKAIIFFFIEEAKSISIPLWFN